MCGSVANVHILSPVWLQLVLEADGYQPYLLSPEKGLRALVQKALELAKDPAKTCVDEVCSDTFCRFVVSVIQFVCGYCSDYIHDHDSDASNLITSQIYPQLAQPSPLRFIFNCILLCIAYFQVHRILVDIVSAAANATPGLGRFPPLKREVRVMASCVFNNYLVIVTLNTFYHKLISERVLVSELRECCTLENK